jgi:hypothetical protein
MIFEVFMIFEGNFLGQPFRDVNAGEYKVLNQQ